MPSTAGTLATALKHHRAGEWNRARRAYWRILAAEPNNAEALHLLGITSHQTGRYDEAAEFLRKAVALQPSRAEFHNALGEALAALERTGEAQSCFEEALRLRPDLAEAHNNLGMIFQAQNQIVPALKCFHRAIGLRPDFAEPYNHAGIIAFHQRQPQDALLFFRKATQIDPQFAAAYANMGIVYLALEQYPQAAECSHQALRLNPRYAAAQNTLGILHQIQGQFESALACFREAIRLDDKSFQAHNNLGNALRGLGRLPEALTSYQRALELSPHFSEARVNLSQLLSEQGRHAEAMAGYELALRQAPNDAIKVLSLLTLPAIPQSLDDVRQQRRRFEANLARLAQEPLAIEDPARHLSNLVFYLAYQGMNDRAVMMELAALYRRATPSLTWTASHCRQKSEIRNPKSEGNTKAKTQNPNEMQNSNEIRMKGDGSDFGFRISDFGFPSDFGFRISDFPLRIGFISHHFYNHSVGRLYAGFIRELSRQRFHVTVFTFLERDDPLWRFIRDGADAVVRLPFSLAEARQQIAEQKLDVLFYTDIGMDPWTYCLAHARLAPVQCSTWGHPITSGVPNVDYFLSSCDLDPPEGDEHYSERLVRLENLTTYFYRIPLPAQFRPRRFFGLEEDDHLYVCPQSLFKLHPEYDGVFDAILRADPRGRIILVAGHCDHWTTLLKNRYRDALGPRAERVLVLPRQQPVEFLSLLKLADAVLDPIHFGSGVSTLEAFAIGSPVVTWPSPFLRTRVTYAMYRRMGILDCVAADTADYVRIALRLANDPAWRAEVSQRILAANGVLFENRGILGEVEQFFLTAVAHAKGEGQAANGEQDPLAIVDNEQEIHCERSEAGR